jgi:hypothetical protein
MEHLTVVYDEGGVVGIYRDVAAAACVLGAPLRAGVKLIAVRHAVGAADMEQRQSAAAEGKKPAGGAVVYVLHYKNNTVAHISRTADDCRRAQEVFASVDMLFDDEDVSIWRRTVDETFEAAEARLDIAMKIIEAEADPAKRKIYDEAAEKAMRRFMASQEHDPMPSAEDSSAEGPSVLADVICVPPGDSGDAGPA